MCPRPGGRSQRYFKRAQKYDQCNLHQQDQREAETEFGLAGLVVKEEHAQDGAYAAADDGEQQQDCFGDAIAVLHGADLVRGHGGNANEIDDEQVDNKYDFRNHSCTS